MEHKRLSLHRGKKEERAWVLDTFLYRIFNLSCLLWLKFLPNPQGGVRLIGLLDPDVLDQTEENISDAHCPNQVQTVPTIPRIWFVARILTPDLPC